MHEEEGMWIINGCFEMNTIFMYFIKRTSDSVKQHHQFYFSKMRHYLGADHDCVDVKIKNVHVLWGIKKIILICQYISIDFHCSISDHGEKNHNHFNC